LGGLYIEGKKRKKYFIFLLRFGRRRTGSRRGIPPAHAFLAGTAHRLGVGYGFQCPVSMNSKVPIPYIGTSIKNPVQRPLTIGWPLISTIIHDADHCSAYSTRSISFGFGGKGVGFIK
jgi:hypothetical protein